MIEPERWAHSKAKAVLKQLLESDKTILDMDEALPPDLIGHYRFDRFKDNTRKLKKKFIADNRLNTFQEAALAHDRKLFPKNPIRFWGYGRWDEAEAKKNFEKTLKQCP
jgi:hypothetical protein